ncbi:MAG: DUF1492 domain-containing protein [Tissierellia bacterium]|nr:DUF1492 domain-containing protein [Tissierellia bacterium]
MTAKQYLKQLINLDLYIKVRQEDYEITLTMATKKTQILQEIRVQTSQNLHGREDIAARCAQISIDIDRGTRELIELREEARDLIDRLDDNRHKAILTLRYMLGRSWVCIAEEINYTERQIHRLHTEALLALETIMSVNVT